MLVYKDPFLKGLVNATNEEDAAAAVATYGSFTDTQVEQLTILKAYCLCCIGNVKAPDDIFNIKFKMYQKEFNDALQIAKAKSPTGVAKTLFSIPISRA